MNSVKNNRIGGFISRIGHWLNPWVSRHPTLLHALRSLRARMPEAKQTLQSVFMEEFGRSFPNASFIQVGANDGSMADPLRRQILKRKWSGIMIEPVPDIFSRLVANYRFRKKIILENVAIAAEPGERDFYSLRPVQDLRAAGLPAWYTGLGSFYKDIILSHKHLIPDIESRILTRKVPTTTFEVLCEKHGIRSVNLIQIDTEGYDYEVVKLIDFKKLRPQLLAYEHFHLSPEDRGACEALLHSYGYVTSAQWLDTLALHLPSISPTQSSLLGAWKALQEESLKKVDHT